MKQALMFTSLVLFILSSHAYAGDAATEDVAGKTTYDSICIACHGSGLPGIPQLGDAAAWAPRIKQGNDTLYKHSISGYTGTSGMPMPAKGGNPDLSDDDVKAAVDYIVANSQGSAMASPTGDTVTADSVNVAGKTTYESVCLACHGSGLPGVPQLGDAAGWAPRIEQGNDTLYEHAISGYTGAAGMPMPAKGGNPDLSDDEVKAAVDYMVTNSQAGSTVASSQMAPAGNDKTKTCAACHGVDGNSVNPVWPKLAGQHAEYIFKQLKDFHSGARKNAQMSPLVAPLSEEDMQDIATYYSSQKIKIGHASAKTLPLGEQIYRAGDASKGLPACLACHGPSGAGNSVALYPAISGQHAEYTKIQLLAFRDNKRTNDTNKAMQIVSEKMTTEEIDAVANYIQGLH